MLFDYKTDKVVTMVKGMREKNIKIDGIGIQAHVSTSQHEHKIATNRSNIAKQIKKFGDIGLQVHITELDIKTSNESDAEM